MNPYIEKVDAALRSTIGILDVKWLGSEDKKKVLKLEELVRKEGSSLGTAAYYNEGAVEVLSREYVCVVLNNNEFRHASEPSLFWVAGDIVIGEEITDPERLKALKKKSNIKILKKNFVLHFDRIKKTRGQPPVFVVRGLSFPELDGVTGIRETLSASPVGSADIYFKEHFGWDTNAPELGTILIGFNPDSS
jgi:hypothetical protein